jgi:hypothetical protein
LSIPLAQALLFTILSFLQRVQIRSWSPKGYNCVLMIRDSGGEVGAPSAESAHTVENRILIGHLSLLWVELDLVRWIHRKSERLI